MANNKAFQWITLINFFIGLAMRAILIGWLLIIFGIVELIWRGLFLFVNLKMVQWIDWNKISHRTMWLASQLSYFVASLLAVDFGDTGSYAFLHLWDNPSDELLQLYVLLGSINFLISITILVMRRIEKRRINQ